MLCMKDCRCKSIYVQRDSHIHGGRTREYGRPRMQWHTSGCFFTYTPVLEKDGAGHCCLCLGAETLVCLGDRHQGRRKGKGATAMTGAFLVFFSSSSPQNQAIFFSNKMKMTIDRVQGLDCRIFPRRRPPLLHLCVMPLAAYTLLRKKTQAVGCVGETLT